MTKKQKNRFLDLLLYYKYESENFSDNDGAAILHYQKILRIQKILAIKQ